MLTSKSVFSSSKFLYKTIKVSMKLNINLKQIYIFFNKLIILISLMTTIQKLHMTDSLKHFLNYILFLFIYLHICRAILFCLGQLNLNLDTLQNYLSVIWPGLDNSGDLINLLRQLCPLVQPKTTVPTSAAKDSCAHLCSQRQLCPLVQPNTAVPTSAAKDNCAHQCSQRQLCPLVQPKVASLGS